MKICLITQNLYGLGGVQKTVTQIINNIDPKIAQITVFMNLNDNKKCFDINENIEVVDLSKLLDNHINKLYRPFHAINRRLAYLDNETGVKVLEKYYYNDAAQLINYINSCNFDLVIGVTAIYAVFVGFITKRLNCKTIGWLHSTYDGYFHERGQNMYGAEKFALKQMSNLSSIFVLNSKDKHIIEEKTKVKTYIMTNPVQIPPCKENMDKKYDLLFIGRINKKVKGIDYLVQIILKVKNEIPNLKVAIVGSGQDEKYLIKEIKNNKLEQNVSFEGFRSNVNDYYSGSRLMLLTSRWEGFGLTIVEAMANGVPTVSFHNNGPDEIIDNNVNGLLIEKYRADKFAEAIIRCLKDDDYLDSLSKASIIRAEDFSIDNTVNCFIGRLLKL